MACIKNFTSVKVQTMLSAKCTVSIKGTYNSECPLSEWVSNGLEQLHLYSTFSVLLNTQNALNICHSPTHTGGRGCKVPLAQLFTQTLVKRWHSNQYLVRSCLPQGHLGIQTGGDSDWTTDLLVSVRLTLPPVPQLPHVT